MRLRHLLLVLISISTSLAELKRICVCGTQRIPCECLVEHQSKLNNLRDRVFRAFSVPSAPAPEPIQPSYFQLSRNVISSPYGQSIDQPIGYVLTNSPAEAFYLDASTGQLVPTTRPRPFYPVQNSLVAPEFQPQQQLLPRPPLTTASRQSFLVSGAASQAAFRASRMIRPQPTPYYGNTVNPSLSFPSPGIPLPVSIPAYTPYQPQPYFRTVKSPQPGDVEDFSFVDAGNQVVEEDEIDRKYKSFVSGAPPSASIGEVVRTKPRSLLETLPPGLIAKVARKIAAKLPPPKFSFSITPSKSQPSFQ
ncbi:hypothetical protein PENTCL1PPCAC_2709 [Pristionchus entomophagus]|uniref:Uncharacterized protein n=1 Tax=Pristionchus entomophagus TaxID=358040 RepID=A0AAV5SGJ6_9BILA|nr:hypothetical protein PENTCL1PPCAC_2709 [Pristionchus entomophagus]